MIELMMNLLQLVYNMMLMRKRKEERQEGNLTVKNK